MKKETVLVAMSGGVDSSVAAALLVEQGHTVVGVTMKTFCYSGTPGPARTCCGLDGIADARRVADLLGMQHHVFDMEEAFARDVIEDFVQEYAAGRTPNPCVRCNSNTKIPDLLRRGRAFGADAIATGHYARVTTDAQRVRLLRGRDPAKDQSYFLWGLPREVVSSLRLPVGELTKQEVRDTARRLGLPVAGKPESQEICFVPDDDYAGFLASRLDTDHAALRPGRIVRRDGTDLGGHGGYARYTVGQRRGLGGGFKGPLYVLEIRPSSREVVVGTAAELGAAAVDIAELNWIGTPPAPGDAVHVQFRYRTAAAPACVASIDDACLRLRFDEPQRAVTPGQSGVVYRGEEMVGGGRIAAAAPSVQ